MAPKAAVAGDRRGARGGSGAKFWSLPLETERLEGTGTQDGPQHPRMFHRGAGMGAELPAPLSILQAGGSPKPRSSNSRFWVNLGSMGGTGDPPRHHPKDQKAGAAGGRGMGVSQCPPKSPESGGQSKTAAAPFPGTRDGAAAGAALGGPRAAAPRPIRKTLFKVQTANVFLF